MIIPEAKSKEYQPPAKSIARVPDLHWDWLKAIRTGGQAGSLLEYGATLSEIALAGAIALRFPGQELDWNREEARFTFQVEANAHAGPPHRERWRI